MKKITSTILCFLLAAAVYGQHCASASNSLAPRQATGVAGFSPDYNVNPCIDSGRVVYDSIYFENFTTANISGNNLTVNSLKFDSINNLPAGLCWTTNKTNNTFASGETGVIYITGSSYAYPGQYQLNIKVDMTAGPGNVISYSRVDLYTLSSAMSMPMRYYLRVIDPFNPQDTCRPVDTSGVTVGFSAAITPSGSPVICYGTSRTLTANFCTGCSYLWSTGDTSRAISVSGAGSYTVTVSNGSASAVAGPVTPIADGPLVSSFALMQDTSLVNTWIVTDHSTGTGISTRGFNWGDGYGYNDSTYVHTYTTVGMYSVCEQVTDGLGCIAHSCDSLGMVTIPLPSHPIITLSHILCNGDSVMVTCSTCSGCTYLWSTGDSVPYTWLNTPGVYTVTITQGTHSVVATSAPLTRDSLPPPTFTMTQDSAQINLYHFVNTSFNTNTRFNYQWIWGDGSYSLDSIGTNSHTYTHGGSGTTYDVCLQVIDSLGCSARSCDSTSHIIVPLPALPVIRSYNGSLLCNGNPGYIYVYPCTSCTYLWSTGDTTASISTSAAGLYTVTVTQGAHSAASAPFIILVDTVVAHYTLQRDTTTAHHWWVINECSGSHALSYIWSWGDGTYDSNAAPSHNYSSPAYYNICVQVSDGSGCWDSYCDSTTYLYKTESMIGVQVVARHAAGIDDIADRALRVYPNPAYDLITIERSSATIQAAVIYDAQGREMRRIILTGTISHVSVSDLPDGIYTVSFGDRSSAATRLVIVR